MKKLFFILCGVVFITPAVNASEVRNVITDSIQLTVNGSATQTSRLGSSYNVSGSNIEVTTLGGISAGTAGTAMTITDGGYDIKVDGQAFTFSESGITGDTLVATQAMDTTTGNALTHNAYGELVTTTGGTRGTLAGTLIPTGIATVTAGGQGTTALGQRTITLSVFD